MSSTKQGKREAATADLNEPRDPVPPGTRTTCRHCATPFRTTEAESEFCCSGCRYVYQLIQGEKLGQFYDLKGRGEPQPAGPFVFLERSYDWLREAASQTQGPTSGEESPSAELDLDVQGVSCVGCVWLIEKLAMRREGAVACEVNASLGRMRLRWEPERFDVIDFARELQRHGYLVGPATEAPKRESGLLVFRLGLCGAFALNTMLFTLPRYLGMEADFEYADLFEMIALAFSTLAFLVGGSYFFRRSLESVRRGVLHIDLPISLGLIAAFAGSIYAAVVDIEALLYIDFVAIFVFLMLAGRWLQQRAVESHRHLLLEGRNEPPPLLLAPPEIPRDDIASLPREEHEALLARAEADPLLSRLPVSDIQPGMRYIVTAGRAVPVRSRLLSPAGTFAMDWITGESDTITARAGQEVVSGALVASKTPIIVEAQEAWGESTLAALLQVVPRSEIESVTFQRAIAVYIVVVIAIAAGGFAGWLAAGGEFAVALQVAISVLVVSCPCALGVALPLAEEIASSRLRKRGLFVRDATIWSRLLAVRHVIFDKTGTLTLENLTLDDPSVIDALDARQRQTLLRLVSDNPHPVAVCLRSELLSLGVRLAPDDDSTAEVQETVGLGVALTDNAGIEWKLGRESWALALTESSELYGGTSGGTKRSATVLARDGVEMARFTFRDALRDSAREEVDALKAQGRAVHILSGDAPAKVAEIAHKLGIPDECATGGMTPDQKERFVRELDQGDTLMIGDGANDSLAFNAASVRGTPAIDRGLLEQKADFFFMGRGLGGISALFEMAQAKRNIVRRVLASNIAYNVAVIAVSLAGAMNPLVAAILMPLSSVASLLVVVSGLARRG